MTAHSLLVILALALAPRIAAAYPHYQLSSSSTACAQCHISPAGGGPLNEYGQMELGDTVSGGGDGRFLHGAVELPGWLAVGGDVRLAALANDTGSTEGTELAAFPMQLDVDVFVTKGALTIGGSIGMRGAVRSGRPDAPSSMASEVDSGSFADRFMSREHYVMYKTDALYVRAGRYAAPYGLRLADHTAYVRRYLGYNLSDETYSLGGGLLRSSWELHATAFVSDPIQGAARKEGGVAVMFESQHDTAVVGVSGRAGLGAADTRLQAGPHVKLWIPGAKLLLQGEAHAVRELFDGPGDRWQLATYAGPVLVPIRGLYIGAAYQAFAEDLQVRAVTRHAGDAWVSYLPIAHLELMLSARAQWVGPHERAYVTMAQVHYSL